MAGFDSKAAMGKEFDQMSVGSGDGKRKTDVFATTHDMTRTRPKHVADDKKGSSGQPIALRSNYIKVDLTEGSERLLFQYHVDFEPVVDSKRYRQQLIREPMGEFGFPFEQYLFDGAILYVPRVIEGTAGRSPVYKTAPHPNAADQQVTLTFKLTNELVPGDHQCITVLNLCNRQVFSLLDFRQLQRHFFDPNRAAVIEKHGLEIWPGMISAIRCFERGLLMNLEMAHKVLRVETVMDFMLRLYNQDSNRFKELCVQDLVGSTVMTRYNNKTYRVDDIIWDMNPTHEFEMADGSRKNFKTYYEENYGKRITDDRQPLLLSRAKKRGGRPGEEAVSQDIFLVPELCAMTGLTDSMRADRRVMQDLAQYTRVSPAKRVADARDHVRSISKSEAARQVFSNWNLELDNDLVHLQGRVLPKEKLTFGGGRSVECPFPSAEWSREAKFQRLLSPAALSNWVLMFPAADRATAEAFFNTIRELGPRIGVDVATPAIVQLEQGRVQEYIEKIRQHVAEQKPTMIVTLVSSDAKTRYDAIKKECCIENPTPNQVVLTRSLSKQNILQSVCAKVLFQMTCKMGGSLWSVDIPMMKPMIVGYDSYHDSTARGKSVGAAVFSLDREMTRWFSQCELHGGTGGGGDQISNLAMFCRNALRKYRDVNGCLPDRVFFFRDGVGEGQIPVVWNMEMPQIQKVFDEFYVGGRRVVGSRRRWPSAAVAARSSSRSSSSTRRSTRASSRRRRRTSRTRRPARSSTTSSRTRSGQSLVDLCDERWRRFIYDYFLVPQAVNQGTVTPVSYNVIKDTNMLKPDQLQRLSYKLCHLYYNWQGTIRVPAPCQYAHKLAFLVAQSLHAPAHESLSDKLFFL